jgi:hypothetical protein
VGQAGRPRGRPRLIHGVASCSPGWNSPETPLERACDSQPPLLGAPDTLARLQSGSPIATTAPTAMLQHRLAPHSCLRCVLSCNCSLPDGGTVAVFWRP